MGLISSKEINPFSFGDVHSGRLIFSIFVFKE